MRALQQLDDQSHFRFWGGDLMSEIAGNPPVKHIEELAFMGFWEVAVNLRAILRNFKLAKSDILAYSPDVLILVDYPGFNLRMAEWAKKRGIKVAYYIAPQVWAWKENRVKKIKKFTDKLLTILPFEEDYFKEKGVEQAVFVGHPLLDHFKNYRPNKEGFDSEKKYFGIVPGSRKQEVDLILPPMATLFPKFRETQFGISQSSQLAKENDIYEPYVQNHLNVSVYTGRQHDLLSHCYAALVKSGTSTLEAALLNVPQAVIYKANPISFYIAKKLVNVKYISLVNLILDEPLIEEHIQSDVNPLSVEKAYLKLQDESERSRIFEGYGRLRKNSVAVGVRKKQRLRYLHYFNFSFIELGT
jgi:lipid-A-disaccharide synthase